MTLGRGIFLMTIGLILALAVRDRVGTFDLSMIGWILTGVGLLVFTLSFLVGPARTAHEPDVVDEPDDVDEV
ncbi:DUF6458 family protein [Jiangella asiatica]|uniref:DUF6458 domain-containing protein n=1 Tax=Jiangella asiatica TaxID=2530372 RepID=A0A4R5D7P1_9ACTN|nr:DUF6458 family protein [Jiangella asiatica]TDE07364.1 hypothetical protein E1269_19985 [Jiangella asiatica]